MTPDTQIEILKTLKSFKVSIDKVVKSTTRVRIPEAGFSSALSPVKTCIWCLSKGGGYDNVRHVCITKCGCMKCGYCTRIWNSCYKVMPWCNLSALVLANFFRSSPHFGSSQSNSKLISKQLGTGAMKKQSQHAKKKALTLRRTYRSTTRSSGNAAKSKKKIRSLQTTLQHSWAPAVLWRN